RNAKTYNSGDSLVVTHLTTSPPVRCLSTAERTGSSVLIVLWSYVKGMAVSNSNIINCLHSKGDKSINLYRVTPAVLRLGSQLVKYNNNNLLTF
ncbi:hypothetical protein BDW02DRAFT_511100, partial [Decorospora gaudefroyi]